jgi:hypothetical protein
LGRGLDSHARTSGHATSFPELVSVHHLWRKQLAALEAGDPCTADTVKVPLTAEWQRALATFEREHGRIVFAHWCKNVPSAVAVTIDDVRGVRRVRTLWRGHPHTRFHMATDWATTLDPDVSKLLHRCQQRATKASEVLVGTSERLAVTWIGTIAAHLLTVPKLERESTEQHPFKGRTGLLRSDKCALDEVDDYYPRAGPQAARLVYVWGMLVTLVLLGALAGGLALLWRADAWGLHDTTVLDLAIAVAMGAVGAVVSVLFRMGPAGKTGFKVDYEVGRRIIRRLGYLRPPLGAASAVVIYGAMQAGMFHAPTAAGSNDAYVVMVVSFVAGFSERWLQVIVRQTESSADDADADTPSAQQNGAGLTATLKHTRVLHRDEHAHTGSDGGTG